MKYRKSNRTKQIYPGCSNNAGCPHCTSSRLHSSEVRLQDEIADLEHVDDHDISEADLAACHDMGVCPLGCCTWEIDVETGNTPETIAAGEFTIGVTVALERWMTCPNCLDGDGRRIGCHQCDGTPR
jgi:hypothetical protein